MYRPLNPCADFVQFVSKDLWYNLILVRHVMLCEHTHKKRQSKKERLILKYYFKIGNEWARRKGCGLVAKRTRRKEGVLGRKRMTFEILEVRGPGVWDGQILETTVGGGGQVIIPPDKRWAESLKSKVRSTDLCFIFGFDYILRSF